MYRIICPYGALLLSACGSDKEPLFRPTAWPRLPQPQPTKMQISGHVASLAHLSQNRDPDDRHRLFARLG